MAVFSALFTSFLDNLDEVLCSLGGFILASTFP